MLECVFQITMSKNNFKGEGVLYLALSTCLETHAMQHVKDVTEERSLVLSCIHNSSTLCFLWPGAVAPAGAETGM